MLLGCWNSDHNAGQGVGLILSVLQSPLNFRLVDEVLVVRVRDDEFEVQSCLVELIVKVELFVAADHRQNLTLNTKSHICLPRS